MAPRNNTSRIRTPLIQRSSARKIVATACVILRALVRYVGFLLTPLGPQSRFGDKLLEI